MFNRIIVFSLLFNVIVGEKRSPDSFFQFLGLRDPAPKAAKTLVQSINDTSPNEKEISLINGVLIPKASQEECNHSQILIKSGIPLVNLGGRYYYFGTYFKTNFIKAMQFCRDHGMDLLSIESHEENSRILNHLITNVNKIDHFWTSGSDLGEEGQFAWLATGKSLDFTYWSPPQPDNAGNSEDCLEIWKLSDKHYAWNDAACTNDHNFICEVKQCSDFCIQ